MDKQNWLGKTAVLSALTTRWLGQSYQYEEAVGSTNVLLKEMAEAGAEHGTVLLTNFQSKGKGRLGRQWEAAPGTALLLSVLLRLDWPLERLAWVTMLGSVAMTEAIEQVTQLDVGLKWPNDVMVRQNGDWCKTCGLLAEVVGGQAGKPTAVILGSGVNVNIPAEQLPQAHTPPTSLMLAAGESVSRIDLLVAYLLRLEHGVETAVSGQSPLAAWAERLITIGEPVTVTQVNGGQSIAGVAEAVDECGHLLVRDAAGVLHSVASGDVTLRNH